MTKFNWRTCKRQEAELIRDHFFEQCHADAQPELDAEQEESERYEHARDLADRHASDFADRHFGRMC